MNEPLNMITVCVDYVDILSLTLPYNRHHFDQVTVVSDPHDKGTCEWSDKLVDLCKTYDCDLVSTSLFTENGATFNKFAALEFGIESMGRRGFLCVMDADIVWPKDLHGWQPEKGYLYTPLRHMHTDLRQRFSHINPDCMVCHGSGKVETTSSNNEKFRTFSSCECTTLSIIPSEKDWWQFPTHRNISEWAGYSHTFHVDDPYLGKPPWYETNWRHAGGADSFFQLKWPLIRKRRPPWNCLHLGASGENWCGRSTPYLDGSRHPQADVRRLRVREFIRGRHAGPGRFDNEQIKSS